jgi:hypothetical protein
MNAGRVIETDSPSNLMKKYDGNLEEVYLTLTGRTLRERDL